jgi:hypothetical protein
LKSRVRSAAFEIRRRSERPRASECNATDFSDGRKRRLVLTFEWLTLWPVMGPMPVSSQRRDISGILVRVGAPAETGTRKWERAGNRPVREVGI